GSYVCGEESALIESLEGKRGVPRNRPPYPVTNGYKQQPTIVNNVETLCAAALIAVRGGDWYRSLGTLKSAGTKILSVAGDVAHPGLYEYPFGVTLRQVLGDCGAADTQAIQISGPSGVCVDANEFGRRIAFEDLPTAGAFTVFDASRDMFDVARNYAQFFAHESCGFCTPCRVGTSMLVASMDKIHAGNGTQHDIGEIDRLNKVLLMSAHCGLGHTACNPILDTLKRFRPAYERKLRSLDFTPAFDLDGALHRAREVESETDELNDLRRTLVQMLFAEGNHFCPSCEKSGNCVLQALGYDLGVMTAGFRHFFPDRPVDASHPELLLDFNRCILCELCVRAAREVDGKHVFSLAGRGLGKHLIVNAESGRLADTDVKVTDKAVEVCPVGVILRKRVGFATPIGARRYDESPISAQALADAPRPLERNND
ncbi:MAG: ferredoxin, partial [Proteobacteria bacterium]|nr:ferredoxin [Pseudomonadota bacterium]